MSTSRDKTSLIPLAPGSAGLASIRHRFAEWGNCMPENRSAANSKAKAKAKAIVQRPACLHVCTSALCLSGEATEQIHPQQLTETVCVRRLGKKKPSYILMILQLVVKSFQPKDLHLLFKQRDSALVHSHLNPSTLYGWCTATQDGYGQSSKGERARN